MQTALNKAFAAFRYRNTGPMRLTVPALRAESLPKAMFNCPLLDLASCPDGVRVVLAVDDMAATVAPPGAEVWTLEDLALAALLTPDRLAAVRRAKREFGPGFRLPPPHPPAPTDLRLPLDGADLPPALADRLRERLSTGPPVLYAGWGCLGRVAGIGTWLPVPVFYCRDEAHRAAAPERGEVWTPDELAEWAGMPADQRAVVRRWKQEWGREAVV